MFDAAPRLALLERKLRNLLVRYRRLRPARLAQDVLRARRLRSAAVVPRPPEARPERVVVTLTSIPERAEGLAPVLRSLLDQTSPADRIVLNWQSAALATGEAYPPPPPAPAGVDVIRRRGSGPATKLLPTLLDEPEAVLVVVDDDVIYPVDFIETMLKAHRDDPGAALGYRGWRLQAGLKPRNFEHVFGTALDRAEPADVLIGTWGYLIPPGALDHAVQDFTGWPLALQWVDDVWIAGHLARRNVPRKVIPARGLPIETAASAIRSLSEGPNRSGENDLAAIAAFAPWR